MKINFYSHPNTARVFTTGPSEWRKCFFLTNLISNLISEFRKIYIYSPSLYQDIYQKLNKCFINFILTSIIQDILNADDLDNLIEDFGWS